MGIQHASVGANITQSEYEGATSHTVSGDLSLTTTSVSSFFMADGGNIALASASGTKIGTTSTQKLGFFGASPTIQLAHVASTGVASTMVISLLTYLENIGLMKST